MDFMQETLSRDLKRKLISRGDLCYMHAGDSTGEVVMTEEYALKVKEYMESSHAVPADDHGFGDFYAGEVNSVPSADIIKVFNKVRSQIQLLDVDYAGPRKLTGHSAYQFFYVRSYESYAYGELCILQRQVA